MWNTSLVIKNLTRFGNTHHNIRQKSHWLFYRLINREKHSLTSETSDSDICLQTNGKKNYSKFYKLFIDIFPGKIKWDELFIVLFFLTLISRELFAWENKHRPGFHNSFIFEHSCKTKSRILLKITFLFSWRIRKEKKSSFQTMKISSKRFNWLLTWVMVKKRTFQMTEEKTC